MLTPARTNERTLPPRSPTAVPALTRCAVRGVEMAAQDYVYVAYFLICTSTFLKIRWWVGTLVLMAPMVLADLWHRDSERKVRVRVCVYVRVCMCTCKRANGLRLVLAERAVIKVGSAGVCPLSVAALEMGLQVIWGWPGDVRARYARRRAQPAARHTATAHKSASAVLTMGERCTALSLAAAMCAPSKNTQRCSVQLIPQSPVGSEGQEWLQHCVWPPKESNRPPSPPPLLPEGITARKLRLQKVAAAKCRCWTCMSALQVHTLPHDALVHMVVAWAVGGLMAYLAGRPRGGAPQLCMQEWECVLCCALLCCAVLVVWLVTGRGVACRSWQGIRGLRVGPNEVYMQCEQSQHVRSCRAAAAVCRCCWGRSHK